MKTNLAKKQMTALFESTRNKHNIPEGNFEILGGKP